MEQKIVKLSAFFLFLAVLFGAFGAHGLKDKMGPDLFQTYQTGVEYLFYHAFALILYAVSMKIFSKKCSQITVGLFVFGIIVFCGFCMTYAITQIKIFALLVPLGGTAFLIAWLRFVFELRDMKNN